MSSYYGGQPAGQCPSGPGPASRSVLLVLASCLLVASAPTNSPREVAGVGKKEEIFVRRFRRRGQYLGGHSAR